LIDGAENAFLSFPPHRGQILVDLSPTCWIISVLFPQDWQSYS
jgi:hypothetical protein